MHGSRKELSLLPIDEPYSELHDPNRVQQDPSDTPLPRSQDDQERESVALVPVDHVVVDEVTGGMDDGLSSIQSIPFGV